MTIGGLGVSTKTVRRLVDDLAVPHYRVGRRVLVSFREADEFVRRVPMATAPTTKTPIVDPVTGRRREISEDERLERSARLQRTLATLAEPIDEADDPRWDDVLRGVAAARPE